MKGKAILLLSLFSIGATFKETTEQLLELPLRLAISTVKLPAFFQKFKNQWALLGLMTLNLLPKMFLLSILY